jgi:hypothetical protein
MASMTGVCAAEDLVEPGQWRVTSSNVINGMAAPPQAKARCITPQQAEDVARTFGPVSGTINSDCADPEVETNGKTLSWRLRCRGQLDADVAARFNFDTPQHYTATITFQGRMGGAVINDTKTEIAGERLGDCAQ